MRIIGGYVKGRKLKSFRGMEIRPTYDRIRETLFNILGLRIEGSAFLDLFAGTGNVGLEALSRGASPVVFIDSSQKAVNLIKANIAICDFPQDRYRILHQNVFQALPFLLRAGMQFHFIFADPPYQTGLAQHTLEEYGKVDILKEEGIVIIQHHKKEPLASRYGILELSRTKETGDTVLSFYQKEPPT